MFEREKNGKEEYIQKKIIISYETKFQSIYDHQGIKTGKTIQKLTIKRNKKINAYFHKTSR